MRTTRLPNANNETGLGLDTTDVFGSILIGKTVQSVRIVGNAGVGILGVPTRGDIQNDVLTYGLSFASRTASSTDETFMIGSVGPKVSSVMHSIEWSTSTSTVGG